MNDNGSDTKTLLDEYHAGLEAAIDAGAQSPVRKAFETGALMTRQKRYEACKKDLEGLFLCIEEGDAEYISPYVTAVQGLLDNKPLAQVVFQENEGLLSGVRAKFQALVSQIGQDLLHDTFLQKKSEDSSFSEIHTGIAEDIGIFSASVYIN